MEITDLPIVFFDGECGLCDRFVKYLVRLDKGHRLRFAALQGATATATLGAQTEPPEQWSIQYVDTSGTYLRSSGALRAIAEVGGIWKAAKLFLIVPPFMRDAVYRWVATNRYRWFGKVDMCMLPSPTLKERFLP